MQDILIRLHELQNNFNLPANDTHMRLFNNMLQAKSWPEPDFVPEPVFDDLLAIYHDHNGMPISTGRLPMPLRLMSFEEAQATNVNLRNANWTNRSQLMLWTDDNSNYFGLYLKQPLMGRVVILKHDDVDYAPRYRSVRSLYETMLTVAETNHRAEGKSVRWYDMPTDYPNTAPNPDYDTADREAAQFYIDKYNDEDDEGKRRTNAFVAMNLLPFSDREPLVMFADDDRDMYVQERALELFGKRQDDAAVEQIERIVRTVKSNPRSAGIIALGNIGMPNARDALLRLIHDSDLGRDYVPSLLNSLKQIGYETRREGEAFSYRTSPDDDWIDF